MVKRTYSKNTIHQKFKYEAEDGRLLRVQGQFGVQREFHDSLGYRMKLCLKKQNKKAHNLAIEHN